MTDGGRPRGSGVHREQVITGQVVAFPFERANQQRPRSRGDTSTFLPLLNGPSVLTHIDSHRRQRGPALENVMKGAQRFHGPQYASDELSGQCPPINPMTLLRRHRTISPMGRGTTPVRLRQDLAKRLKAARIHARFTTQKEAADSLRIGLDRYEKWESGRTPIPADFVKPICDLFNVDANYLYGIDATPKERQTG